MDFQKLLSENVWISNIFYSIIAIVVAVIIYEIMSKLVSNKISKSSLKLLKGKKSYTYIKLFRSINRYFFIMVMVFVVLRINGVNITSIVTGVGVVGIIFGFAVQDALKDIIKGIDIITDSYYHVGDVVKIGEYVGVVTVIGIKTTKLEGLYDKSTISISNRNIEKVEVLSHIVNIDIPLPYELKLSDAEEAIRCITHKIEQIDNVEKVEYTGVNDFSDSSIKYQIKVHCPPNTRIQTKRNALTCILGCLEEREIHIPFTQIDIHQK